MKQRNIRSFARFLGILTIVACCAGIVRQLAAQTSTGTSTGGVETARVSWKGLIVEPGITGQYTNVLNWCNAASPSNWHQISGLPWKARQEAGCCQHNGRIYIAGGVYAGEQKDATNDVWYTTDMTNWTCATDGAPWYKRRSLVLTSSHSNLWITGGWCGVIVDPTNDVWVSAATNDAWVSTDMGTNWTMVTNGPGYTQP